MADIIKIELKRGVWVPSVPQIRVRADHDFVILLAGEKVVEFRTPAAHKAGFALCKKAGEALIGEFVIMTINGEPLELLPEQALKVGGALLRKADFVDDYQLSKRKVS